MSLGARAAGSHRAHAAQTDVLRERDRCRLAVQASTFVEQRLAVVTAVADWRWSKHADAAVDAHVDEVHLLWYFPAPESTRRELGVIVHRGEDWQVAGPVFNLLDLGRVLSEAGA